MGKQVTLKYQISEGRKRIASEYLEGRRLLRERYKTGRVETSKGEVGNRDLKEEIEVKNGAVGFRYKGMPAVGLGRYNIIV